MYFEPIDLNGLDKAIKRAIDLAAKETDWHSGALYPPKDEEKKCESRILKTETKKEDDKLVIRLFVPGVPKEQIHVQRTGEKTLKVSIDRPDCDSESKEFNIAKSESINLGCLQRKVVFPPKVSLELGILTIKFDTAPLFEETTINIDG